MPAQLYFRRSFALLLLMLATLSAFVAPAYAQQATLTVTPAVAPQNSTVTLALAGFQPDEDLSLWQTLPDLSTRPLGDLTADASGGGQFALSLDTTQPVGEHRFSARGNRSGRSAETRFTLTPAEGAPASPGVTISATPANEAGQAGFIFNGSGYRPGEPVALWLRNPAGRLADLGQRNADEQGRFNLNLHFANSEPEGAYFLTGYGKQSSLTGIARFEVRHPDQLDGRSGAILIASPRSAPQLATITLIGADFQPGERISVWLTMPDGAVMGLFEGITTDGTFAVELKLPPLPVGRHYFTAFGQTSRLRAVEQFDLLPGAGG